MNVLIKILLILLLAIVMMATIFTGLMIYVAIKEIKDRIKRG